MHAITALNIGFTNSYIHDHNPSFVAQLPVEAAVAWVQAACPDAIMDASGRMRAMDLTIGGSIDTDAMVNGWLNKRFVIVGEAHGNWLSIYRNDDNFELYSLSQG